MYVSNKMVKTHHLCACIIRRKEMKNCYIKNLLFLVSILMIMSVFIVQPIILQAVTLQPIAYIEDQGAIYDSVIDQRIYYKDSYYSVETITYGDGSYNSAVFISEDGINWKLSAQLQEKSISKPVAKSIRVLNNRFLVSVSNHNGEVLYLSKDGITWEPIDLQFEDITCSLGMYWAIDSTGAIFYSNDLSNWSYLTQLVGDMANLNTLDLSVTENTIVVSHYNTRWGSDNYKNGLEVYDRQQSVWSETIGYDGQRGTTKDIVWTGEKWILVYQNDYMLNSPFVFYTSTDGVNWKVEEDRAALIRTFNALKDTDTSYTELIKILNDLIQANNQSGGITPVLVQLDGKAIEFKQDAVLKNNRVLVPVREFFEMLGGTVTWNAATQQVTGQVGANKIQLTIGNTVAYVNDKPITLDVPALIINGRTLVPARFIADSVGKKVDWDKDQYIVKISTVQ